MFQLFFCFYRGRIRCTVFWHFSLPVLDDATDLWLLWETFGGSHGGLWWACLCVFVLRDIERAYTAGYFVALLLRVALQALICCFCVIRLVLTCLSLSGNAWIIPNPGTHCWIRCSGPCSNHVLDLVRFSILLGWQDMHRHKRCRRRVLTSTQSTPFFHHRILGSWS